MKEVTIVTKAACPICVMVKSELEKLAASRKVSVKYLRNSDPDGKDLIARSSSRNAPIVECEGKFYCGRDAMAFVIGLR